MGWCMRYGLIGNMNNNNFALMRYFRDLGADAHVLLFANDGADHADHFSPMHDTWSYDKWAPYVHQTNIQNAPISALEIKYSIFFSIYYFLKKFAEKEINQIASPTPLAKSVIKNVFSNYEILLGSGIAPALLQRINRRLDIFSPYGTGIEYFKNTEFIAHLRSMSGLRRKLMYKVQSQQIRGLQNARYVCDPDYTISSQALKEIGVTPVPLAFPMVYTNDSLPFDAPTDVLRTALSLINESNFSLLHHARLMWVKTEQFTNDEWLFQCKNNDALIRSFAKLVMLRPSLKPILLMVEYGPDVVPSKKLIADLGIMSYVHWLPKMARRELMWLLSKMSVGVGEFYDVPRFLWGGTGWEVLAGGKPLLQGFQFAEGEFEAIYGHPAPPMLPVRSHDDILLHLLDMADNPDKRTEIGQAAKAWFAKYNGIGLAKKWLDLLQPDSSVERHGRVALV